MSSKLKIAQVEYYNTLPFLKGLQASTIWEDIDLIETNPGQCANLFINKEVDVALIPVAALDKIKDYTLFSEWCIGCIADVRTVKVFSNTPFNKLDKIYLDSDSRTSVLLTKVLQGHFLKREVMYSDSNSIEEEDMIAGSGLLRIGDKALTYEGKYRYETDLGLEWFNHTGLPFVFAVWVATEKVKSPVLDQLNDAFTDGINKIPQIIKDRKELKWLKEYFVDHISFEFDPRKKEALQLFRNLVNEMGI